MKPDTVQRISQDLGIAVPRVEATLRLVDEGATVPFIAHYRKDETAHLDESAIRKVVEQRAFYLELDTRRESLLGRLRNKGLLDDELRTKIEAVKSLADLEDLSLPHRSRRGSRAGAARSGGLDPLADYIEKQSGSQAPEEQALAFLSMERGVPSVAVAIRGALAILAERIAGNPDVRRWYRELVLETGVIHARAVAGREGEKNRYSAFYGFSEPVARIPSHRFLALRRGAREKVLSYAIELDRDATREALLAKLNLQPECAWTSLIEQAADDALDRLLAPTIQAQVRAQLRARAESEAIRVFKENLRALLLAPPAGLIPVLGVDAGGNELHLAALGAHGALLEAQTLPVSGEGVDPDATRASLLDLVVGHGIRGVAVGEGPQSSRVESLLRAVVSGREPPAFVLGLGRNGAATWSRSPAAKEEFPDLTPETRVAISLARRLQDPLAELVRLDPRAIGVGQYQHDVSQKKLQASLGETLESAVCVVGADVNTASADLLQHIPGVGEERARGLVAWRGEHGAFRRRVDLGEVPGFDADALKQAAGFLRVLEGPVPMDRTRIHPESYPLVERMASSAGVGVAELVGSAAHVRAIPMADFEGEAGRLRLADIRRELLRPGQDPRGSFQPPRFRDDIREVGDLEVGMELEGQVTNVTDFGAFVNLGVHQDGLIHISELSHGYVSDARRAIRVGDRVQVRVIALDLDDKATKRISLSRKVLLPKPRPRTKPGSPGPKRTHDVSDTPRGPRKTREKTRVASRGAQRGPKPPKRRAAPAEPAVPASMEEKIRQLQEKFRRPGDAGKS
jgi:protein Tex